MLSYIKPQELPLHQMKMKIVLGLCLLIVAVSCADLRTRSHPRNTEKTPRILAGEIALDGQLPWTVGILINNLLLCTGALIKDKYVLTAASCLERPTLNNNYTVLVGKTKLGGFAEGFPVTDYIVHENYDSNAIPVTNNIGLLRLPVDPIALGGASVTLPQADENFEGAIGILSGWGATSDGTPHNSEELRFINQNIIPTSECSSDNDERLLCAIGLDGNQGPCYGDAAAPLVVVKSRGNVLAGVLTSSDCNNYSPSTFTRVSKYLDWIEANTV